MNEYQSLLSETTDQKQKELLRNEIMEISNYATSGEVIENDILKESRELCLKFESANISCAIIKEQEIVRLCNLINNPADVEYY